MVRRNPRFDFAPDSVAVLEALASEFGDQVTRARVLIGGLLEDRDRQIADYAAQGLRREYAARQQGDGTAHTSTSWASVTPTFELVYPKMLDRSKLVVCVAVHGEHGSSAAPKFVEFGVRVTDSQGNQTDNPIVRDRVGNSSTYKGLVGWAEVAAGAKGGDTTVRLRVRVEDGTTTWTSRADSTMSMSVVESL